VSYLWLIIIFIEDDIFVDNDVFLVTDFIILKIKPVQSFSCVHKDMVYVFS
jgi:hypothetical protein